MSRLKIPPLRRQFRDNDAAKALGERFGKLTDPFGHQWALATHVEDVAPEEMGKRAKAAMAQMQQAAPQGA